MKKNILKIAHISGALWILSIAVFLILIINGGGNDGFSIAEKNLNLAVVLTGLFAFLGAFVLYSTHYLFLRNKSHSGTPSSLKHTTSPLVYMLAGVVLTLFAVFGLRGAYLLGKTENASQRTTVISEVSPTPKVEVKYVDSDPIITCTSSHPNCSGESIQARKSQCSNIYCCQVGDNWSVYPSESECLAAQPTAKPQPTAYPPCTINYSGLGPITSYNIPPEDCASKQIEAKIHDNLTETYIKCIQTYGGENCEAPTY